MIKKFLEVLLFFPSVTFSLIKAEIFPYGIIYFLVGRVRLYKNVMLVIFLMIISSIYGALYFQEISDEVIRSIFAYLNPLLVYVYILNERKRSSENIVKFIFFGLLALGLLQFSGLANAIALDSIIDILMSRGGTDVVEGGRGISLLSSEPSRAACEVTFVYILFRYSFLNHKVTIIFDVFIAFFILYFIRSATGLIYISIFLLLEYRLKLVIALGILFLAVGFSDLSSSSRALNLLHAALSQDDFSSFVSLALNASGFRFISVYAAYKSMFNAIFGFGVGFWEFSSKIALNNSGIPAYDISYFNTWFGGRYESVRPVAYFASIALDMGIIGFILLSNIVFKPVLQVFKMSEFKSAYITFAFYLIFLSAVGNPVPWLCIAYLINIDRLKIKLHNE
ncbi:hypothetical protein [Vibrio ziniensis]|uniref:Oligosaccharide repeat unit polymerase n=1 Tax=Vibrio ziniensis TaxID=2711221 RepID=A0A6G7CLG2_9VIBR|nr:hypothetical protein [Vibrio ziniensis]QIH42971.1 hypothetical protein G5S32_13905 [Vibrio ziniensis]